MDRSLQSYVLGGMVISNFCHLLSVFVLYCLLTQLLEGQQRSRIAFVASVLHILTPGSLFFSAPYAEAAFALLNLSGMLFYTKSKAAARLSPRSFREDAYKLSCGICFASATLLRSNGLLSGLILLYDVAEDLLRMVSGQLSMRGLKRVFVTCIAGALIASCFIGPQYLAYLEFCDLENNPTPRPWCEKTIPSIYSWVQSHYWLELFLNYVARLTSFQERRRIPLLDYFEPAAFHDSGAAALGTVRLERTTSPHLYSPASTHQPRTSSLQ